ncbi:hypothetical protein Y1Q_0021626 [Alligator mississippiensis]|uniref:Uncharacterized protein n=1 Tax=Alligator mississippiensis TaxID=8496 RepID=A0A151PAQ6_ALLMI|nr:hypothetical protein Y1Q_0021626 [Alligator mississippiensis]
MSAAPPRTTCLTQLRDCSAHQQLTLPTLPLERQVRIRSLKLHQECTLNLLCSFIKNYASFLCLQFRSMDRSASLDIEELKNGG